MKRLPTILAGLALLVAGYALMVVLSQVTSEPPPGASEDKRPIEVTAREPGVSYDVLKFCNDPSTRGRRGIEIEEILPLYIERGQELIDWKLAGEGKPPNVGGTHYWIDVFGAQQSEPVEISKPAAECIKKKAGVK